MKNVQQQAHTTATTASLDGACVVFTAFEPSGDAHAAPVIRELIKQAPKLRIYALGGPKMEAAGAELIDRTADDGAMGLNSVSRISAVRRQVRSVRTWLQQRRVLAHVAVDSPAANFPICKVMRRSGVRSIHLVAPQMWAWGSWRVRKLRRLTSMVLCLLPFEEQWFKQRAVPARFIGHPVMNRAEEASLSEQLGAMPSGSPRIAIFPGSRSSEVRANIRVLCHAYTELQARYNGMAGVIVAANAELARLVRSRISVFPTGLHLTTANADAAVAWCDLALVVSGTMSLDIARQHKPMIGVYKTGIVSWLGAKLLLRTPYRLLPNIIAGREICPEFIPHIGGSGPILREATHLLHDSKNGAIQSEALRRVCLRFANKRPAEEAARHILQLIKA